MEGLLIASVADIIEAVRNGDRQAFNDLVRSHQDMALAYAYSLLGNYHEAEDAAQEAFVHAYINLPTLRNPAAFPGWFRSLVRTQCTRRQRRGNERMVTVAEAISLASPDARDAQELLEAEEEQSVVAAAIASLPKHEQITVRLFYMGCQSTREIADFLGVSVAAVKSRLHSSRNRLRQELMTMVQDELNEQRPSRDAVFVERVSKHLDSLEALHEGYCQLLQDVLAEALGERPKLKLASVEQRPFEEFVTPLSVPSATYSWQMPPLEGRVVLDLPLPMACLIVDRASGISPDRSEGVR